ncbi:hypothetical protein Aperf_G00000079417 [Anoplocephala perfoliata]
MDIKPDYLSKAISESISGEPRNLNYFINKLSSADRSSDEIGLIIDELLRIKDEIPLHVGEILTKLLTDARPWYVFSPEVSKNAIGLLVALAIRYDELAEYFLSHICSIICSASSYSDICSEIDRNKMAFSSLRDFFASMPHFESSFLNYLHRSFPIWGRPTPQLFSDMANILKLCCDSPRMLSTNTIEKIISACLDLLVNVELRAQLTSNSMDAFPVDLVDPFNLEMFDENFEIISKSLTEKSDKQAALFWLYCTNLLKRFPTYTRGSLRKGERNREWSSMYAVFRDLLNKFIQRILPVQSSFAAFPLLLVFMSTLHPSLGVILLENLWNFVKDARQIEEAQIACIRYMADYLARCKYCTEDVVIEQLHDLAAWCVEYTYHRKGRPISQSLEFMTRNHKPFYTIFESILYVIAFRQSNLFGSNIYRARCAQIPLIQLISSPFKPLDALEPSLRGNFLALSSAYKMNWTSVMPPNGYSTQVDFDPKPSFPCPFTFALRVIPVAGHLGLFNDFIPAKRTRKRVCENGNGIASSSKEPQSATKRLKNSSPQYFNFQALDDLT